MKSSLFTRIIVLFWSCGTGMAQFSTEATVTTMTDDNINNNYLHVSDRVTEAAIKTGYDWESEQSNIQLFSMGSFNYFSATTDRTYYTLAFGSTYSYLFDADEQTLLNAGGTYSLRMGRGDYTFYDNSQLALYTNIKHHFAERVIGRASYSFRSVAFPELQEFNYVEHYGFVQATLFLPTHTTLILEADIGTKIYSTPNFDSTMQGSGRGARRLSSASTPSVTQFIGLARIGQPLMEGTGMSLMTSYQTNLQKESRYLSSEYGTVSDDELFDDHYGYEGWHMSLTLTQLLPAEMTLKATGSLQNRNYTERPAYDLAGNTISATREDTRKTLTLLFEKRFVSAGISLGVTYDYIINASNDAFYHYTNNALTGRIAFTY